MIADLARLFTIANQQGNHEAAEMLRVALLALLERSKLVYPKNSSQEKT